jgi:DNA-binding MarR family transcriptional regulator
MDGMLANLERTVHAIGAHVERSTRDLGITQAEAHVLAHLAREGPVSIASVHRAFGTKRSTLTNVLDRLEGRGLVRRELNPNDRRSFTIRLTRKGDAQARRVRRLLDEVETRARSAVNERDLRGFGAVLEAIEAVLG